MHKENGSGAFFVHLRALCVFVVAFQTPSRRTGLGGQEGQPAGGAHPACGAGRGDDGRACRHGKSFAEYKLRTVIWEFSCEPIEPELRADLESLHTQMTVERGETLRDLRKLLASAEVTAVVRRLDYLLRTGTHPAPIPQRRNYPWPPI